jgi:hypothetical protein
MAATGTLLVDYGSLELNPCRPSSLLVGSISRNFFSHVSNTHFCFLFLIVFLKICWIDDYDDAVLYIKVVGANDVYQSCRSK